VSHRRALLLLPVLAGAPALRAETLYVIEQLVVNVNSAPDAAGTRVSTIKSGDAVEVLERQGEQIHVHLSNGTEGWVRKSYLSEQEPLQHRLNERNAEVEKLKQDVARLESEVAAANAAARGKPGAAAASTVGSNTGGTTRGAVNVGGTGGGSAATPASQTAPRPPDDDPTARAPLLHDSARYAGAARLALGAGLIRRCAGIGVRARLVHAGPPYPPQVRRLANLLKSGYPGLPVTPTRA
jgi:hypothetical protein